MSADRRELIGRESWAALRIWLRGVVFGVGLTLIVFVITGAIR